MFDEGDLEAALARFDELNHQVPQLENAATRAWARQADAFNRRDLLGFLALIAADGRVEDRRKGLRALFKGPARANAARATFEAPASWRLDVQPIAIRGARLALTRACWHDTDQADQPITVELLALTEVGDGDLIRNTVSFDPDDINGAFAELTARWIASGEVTHPEVIETAREVNEVYNRHDWNGLATLQADATYLNHRQLTSGPETIADHWKSMRALASLIPDLWVEGPEILASSAKGLVNSVVVKGTTAEGAAIELPAIILILFDGPRVIRMEAFDLHQRDLALARFEELNRPA